MTAVKFDSKKLRYDLIPSAAEAALAEALTLGATKYSPNNWREGIVYSRLLASLRRHVSALAAGEDRCPVDGQLHLGSIMAIAAMLCEYEATGRKDLDDRPRAYTATPGQIASWVAQDPPADAAPHETTSRDPVPGPGRGDPGSQGEDTGPPFYDYSQGCF